MQNEETGTKKLGGKILFLGMLAKLSGVTLMLWICIQFYMFPPNFMSTIYFMFGFAQAATGYAAWVFALAAPVRSVQCRMGTYKTREL